MAIKSCRECRKDISSEAKVCPNCGKKNPTGGWTLGAKIGAGVIALIALGQVSGRHPSSPTSTMSESSVVAEASGTAQMPEGERQLLDGFQRTCASYKAQPNEIKKSAVFRQTRNLYKDVGPIEGWTGTLTRISTNQGGSAATLVIKVGSSKVYDDNVALGSPVYTAAAEMREGQTVVFSGRGLADFNLTEEGKVCDPDFSLRLTALR